MRRVNAVLNRLTASPSELRALDLDLVKKQQRVSLAVASQDDLFLLWIDAATSLFEEQTGRQLLTVPWELWLDAFPPVDRYIEIPKPPLRTVLGVTYLDADGTEQTLDTDLYTVLAPAGAYCAPGRITLSSDAATWPVTLMRERAVRIEFEAGYGDGPEDVPHLARVAMMYLIGHFHKFGEEVIESSMTLQQMPIGARTIIESFKLSARGIQRPWEVSWLD